jgi:hypothetical protein
LWLIIHSVIIAVVADTGDYDVDDDYDVPYCCYQADNPAKKAFN